MTAWSRKTWKFLKTIFAFLKKTPFYGNIFKILFRKFTWRHRLTLLCLNVVKFVWREIAEIVRYLSDKKETKVRLPLKLSLLRGSRPKSAGASPQRLAHNVPNFTKSVHFRRTHIAERAKAVLWAHNYIKSMIRLQYIRGEQHV